MVALTACFGGSKSDGAAGNGSGGTSSCHGYCENACTAITDCSLDAGTACVDDCVGDLKGTDCASLEPVDRLTCDELGESLACAAHCAAVCHRALECGTFDEKLCVAGCADEVPWVCNEASAKVRDCDDIKLEAREYEELARANRDGTARAHYSPGARYGLCADPGDCELPEGCSFATNTCGACASDDECYQGSLLRAHTCEEGACIQVECARDDQCSGDVCDTETHTCIECRTDADCAGGIGLNTVCDMVQHVCAECRTDAECTTPKSNPFRPACDTTAMTCVECFTDEHCADSLVGEVRHACDVEKRECVTCLEDKHCAGDIGGPACDLEKGFCVECVNNTHCTNAAYSACGSGSCLWCTSDADCDHIEGHPFCNGLSGCVECKVDADCPTEKPICSGGTCT